MLLTVLGYGKSLEKSDTKTLGEVVCLKHVKTEPGD